MICLHARNRRSVYPTIRDSVAVDFRSEQPSVSALAFHDPPTIERRPKRDASIG